MIDLTKRMSGILFKTTYGKKMVLFMNFRTIYNMNRSLITLKKQKSPPFIKDGLFSKHFNLDIIKMS